MNQASGNAAPGRWMTSREAAALLGIKRATLYAYASRGLVRTQVVPGGRERRYLADDLERLRVRRQARRGHVAVAASALSWGDPVLDSKLTEISADGPRYRRLSAVSLARADVPFERVAPFLLFGPPRRWSEREEPDTRDGSHERGRLNASREPDGDEAQLPAGWPSPSDPLFLPLRNPALRSLLAEGPLDDDRREASAPVRLFDAQALIVSRLAMHDAQRASDDPASISGVAHRIVRALAVAPAFLRDPASIGEAERERTVAGTLVRALGATPRDEALVAVNRALVLCADHELNPSSFSARVTASTSADHYACVLSALATFSGPRHGGASTEIEAFVREIGEPESVPRAMTELVRAGRTVPGFGHPLYAAGDPRATPLLELVRATPVRSRELRVLLALVDTMELLGGERPTVDTGLLAVAFAFGLGAEAAQAIFATGRAAGWIAHAIEQRSSGSLLRPRARYAQD